MAREDDIKNFLYGYLIGQKPLGRERAPVDIPVTIINIGYNSDTLTVGESMILLASVYPNDASYQELEWSSSDVSVMTVNKTTALSAEVRAISTGDVIITCKATDGYGATGTVIMHVQAGMIFETLSVNRILDDGIFNIRIASALIELQYTPVAMDGSLLEIELAAPLTGNPTPYIVQNTMFDNIKMITNTFIGKIVEDYLNYQSSGGGSRRLRFSVRATDGSGLSLLNEDVGSIGSEFYMSLYGQKSNTSGGTNTRSLKIGYQTNLAGLFNNIHGYQSMYYKDTVVEIEDDTVITMTEDWIITGVKEGDTTIKITFVDGRTTTCKLHIVPEALTTLSPDIVIIDSTGQRVKMDYEGALNLVNDNTYKGVASINASNQNGGLVKAVLSGNSDVAVINSDGTFTVVGPGGTDIGFDRTYISSGGEVTTRNYVSIRVYANEITVGTCTSEYIKRGLVVYAFTSSPVWYSNKYCKNKINVSFNSNQAELLDVITAIRPSPLNTVTYNPALTSGGVGTINYYQFEKYTTDDVVITFMVEGFPDTATQITI